MESQKMDFFMKPLITTLSLFILTFLVSCSQKTTNARLQLSNSFVFGGAGTSPYVGGGLMIWGRNLTGASFGKTVEDSDSINIQLPNGSWTFFAMAWEGEGGSDTNGNGTTDDKLLGKVRCAISPPVSMTGGDAPVVDLVLSNDLCALPAFVGSDSSVAMGAAPNLAIGSLKIELCESLSNILGASDICSDNEASVFPSKKGHTLSYRATLVSYRQLPGQAPVIGPETISSSCLTGTTATMDGGEINAQLPQIPAGNGLNTPFRMRLEFFPGTLNCDTSHPTGVRVVSLPHGAVTTNNPQAKYFVDNGMAPARHKLFIKMSGQEVCTGGSLTSLFAGGDGAPETPHLICNGQQLQNIVTMNVSNPTKNYKLLKDINLNPYSRGLESVTGWTPPTWYSTCLKKGSNFLPIGFDPNTCLPFNTYQGTFDGGGKTITGLRIRQDQDNVGLFSSLDGAKVRHLKLVRPEVEGKESVGSISGEFFTGSTIARVDVFEIDIRGGSEVGGIVGIAANGNISEVSAQRLRVEGDGIGIGGIVGSGWTGTLLDKIRADGFVRANGFAYDVGGILGAGNGTNVNQSRFEGLVEGKYSLGGIAGRGSNLQISNSYAQAAVVSHTSGVTNSGGLVGKFDAGSVSPAISESYFYGKLLHHCSANDASCKIGPLVGDTGTLVTGDFPNNKYYTVEAANLTTPVVGTIETIVNFFNSGVVLAGMNNVSGDLPRLASEVTLHPCRQNNAFKNIAYQISAFSRGSISNPILLCNYTQLLDAQASPNLHYKMVNSFLASQPITNHWPATFSGSINGDNRGLIGLTLNGSGVSQVGWWQTIGSSGVIKNLHLYGPSFYDDPSTTANSLITLNNYGLLENMKVFGGHGRAKLQTGGLVHTNFLSGKIRNVRWNGSLNVLQDAAGLVFSNLGLIENVNIDGNINCESTLYTGSCWNFGGVAAQNSGTISKVEVGMQIRSMNGGSGEIGLVAVNNQSTGLIEDIHLSRSEIWSSDPSVHGIARTNSGNIRRVISEAKIEVNNSTLPPDTLSGASPTIGLNDIGGTSSHIYYFYKSHWFNTSNSITAVVDNGGDCQATVAAGWNPAVDTDYTLFGISNESSMLYYPLVLSPTYLTNSELKIATLGAGCTGHFAAGNLLKLIYHTPLETGTGIEINETLSLNWSTWSPWDGTLDYMDSSIWIADMSDPTDEARVFNIYKAMLSNEPLPEKPPVWEFDPSDKGLRLFESY